MIVQWFMIGLTILKYRFIEKRTKQGRAKGRWPMYSAWRHAGDKIQTTCFVYPWTLQKNNFYSQIYKKMSLKLSQKSLINFCGRLMFNFYHFSLVQVIFSALRERSTRSTLLVKKRILFYLFFFWSVDRVDRVDRKFNKVEDTYCR